ncbi:MAG: hypothetical protein ACK5FT_05850 [Sphingomonadales bacterium]|jgi:hypothetical protein
MKSYIKGIALLTAAMLLAIFIYNLLFAGAIPSYGYFGVLFLSGLTLFIHYFTYGNPGADSSKTIRRMMVGSMLRMLMSILFLFITLISFKPVSIPFVISYTVSFSIFMVFEIYSIRCKLRPDLKARSK